MSKRKRKSRAEISARAKITSIKSEYSDYYKKIQPDGNIAAFNPGAFSVVFYSDELRPDRVLSSIPPDPSKMELRRIIECQIILTPPKAKSLMQSLTKQIKDYETQYGEITVIPREPEKETFIA